MAVTLDNRSRNATCDALVDLIDAGSANAGGRVNILDADGTTVLAAIDCPAPCFGDAASGTATSNSIPAVIGSASGTATTFEVLDRDGLPVYSGDVTATGGGGTMEISNTSINSGDDVQITSWTHTQPAS